MIFTDPQVILFVADCERAARLYQGFGFRETFRTSADSPVKIELVLGGFGLGLALPGPAAASHGISPVAAGHRACITLWTDDVDAAYRMALDTAGAADILGPHPFLDGRLRVAVVEDLDGHPIQLVQQVA
ncbi:VOC family protein [Nakamurella lactea]|uniref:VOC family protein n=1 Tax=Nakamurella lactea TaxID=459515 RepID=UPI00040BA169|nr:VOC family protein [Nakamurella lactea]